MQPILNIKCPNCNKDMRLREIKIPIGDRKKAVIPKIWDCKNCTIVYPEKWFNEFMQFEHLVTRKEIK